MHSTDGIRAAVDTVGREVALLAERATASNGKDLDALRASWAALVNELALGPAPEYRKCPHCGGIGMRAATLCSTCWKKLVPPPAAADGHGGVPT
ncbi:MAG: hypothetical protein H6Q88_827 [Anaeromyxobacteraceae bacterium]|jgi:hypothetical protein|nr:hypothetical protein [Anaeromyxobacteraceae bacterium]